MIKSLNIFRFAVILFLIGLSTSIYAQRIVNVQAGVGTLNATIEGDTTSTGERVDESTIYVLASGGYYLTTGTISNEGWPLRIQAEDNYTVRPIIQPAVIEGAESTYPFRARGDFYLTGVYLTNTDQDGVMMERPIRLSADSAKLVVDDCHIDYCSQAALRVDNLWNDIIFTNSVFSNLGRMESPSNGRGIDDRGNAIDSLIMRNNTFYNITMTVVRDGGGIINYCDVDHNTIVNIGQFGIHFGEVVELHFTNNIMIDPGFLGRSASETRPCVQVSTLGEDLGVQQIVDLDYNNFYVDPTLAEQYPDSILTVAIFDSTTSALMEANGTGSHNISEAITFTSSPDSPTSVINSYYDNDVALELKEDLDDGDGGPVAGEGVPVQLPFDFAYASTFSSYTASSTGGQIGDLSWFGIEVGVEDDPSTVPTGFSLSNNYPNPFNPTTTIKYSVPSSENVRLVVYNMLGEEVKTLVNSEQGMGSYTVTWDGTSNMGSKVASGMYIYRLTAGKLVQSKKMILMK